MPVEMFEENRRAGDNSEFKSSITTKKAFYIVHKTHIRSIYESFVLTSSVIFNSFVIHIKIIKLF
jgi:hypothetical protein